MKVFSSTPKTSVAKPAVWPSLALPFFVFGISTLLLCSCSSAKKASPMLRTPDFCNTAEGITITKAPKKAIIHPAAGTPVGGNYSGKRR